MLDPQSQGSLSQANCDLLNSQATMKAAIDIEYPKERSGRRQGSSNEKQQRLTAAKASALGNCLQGKAGGRPEPLHSKSAAKALVHWMVHSVTGEIHQDCPALGL